jgi:hypothetical protein
MHRKYMNRVGSGPMHLQPIKTNFNILNINFNFYIKGWLEEILLSSVFIVLELEGPFMKITVAYNLRVDFESILIILIFYKE